MVSEEQRAHAVAWVLEELQGRQGPTEPQERLAALEQLARRAVLELRERREFRAALEARVPEGGTDLTVTLELQVRAVVQDRQGRQVEQGLRERLVTLAQREGLGLQGLQELREGLAQRERQDPQVQQAVRVLLGLEGGTAPTAIQAP